MTVSAPVLHDERKARRAAFGSFVGTSIEWYDFYLFGTAAALVLPTVFFPGANPAIGLLASFATFWAGFLARPLGGLFFGHIGDRLGRKNTLVVTLMIMGVATFLIGLLPGADAWGMAAPILLIVLRAAQGFAVGGEWGGAVLMASESAQKGRGVRSAMWVQQGSPVGSILATVAFLLVGLLDQEAFLSWGWRVPFLASAVLVAVGLLIRLKVEESPEFEAAASDADMPRIPISELLRHHWGTLLVGVLACGLGIGGAYFTSTFMLSYTTTQLGVDRQTMLMILLGTVFVQFAWQPIAARIAERVGTARFMVVSLVAAIAIAFPAFLVISSGEPLGIFLVLAAVMIPTSGYYAVLAGFLAQAFPVRIRYTGISAAYQLCATLIGGTTPLLAQLALNIGGGSWVGIAVFYVILIGITLIGVVGVTVRSGFSAAAEKREREVSA
ncbi:MFS transporter [Microbacterium paludicola]|uniref:MFS transporter n=1 Tax=Microbacterium paludicola TaxID=300019 RepID=UPI000903F9D5|nr:MFS transporter [Microbacterium paludicola]APF32883.1 MFS transporter [Microbacterium paludicola]